MTKREATKIFPTMKAEATEDSDLTLAFSEATAVIKAVKDIDTKHGNKTVLTLSNEELNAFQVFVNNKSMSNLIEAFGDDDADWKGQSVTLKKETDEVYNNEMIVVYKAE